MTDPGHKEDGVWVEGVGRIGYIREWENHPGTWDGWVDWPGDAVDELVHNGGDQYWVTYRIIRRYQELLLDGVELAAHAMRTAEERSAFARRAAGILDCNDRMREVLEWHFEHVREEGRRLGRAQS